MGIFTRKDKEEKVDDIEKSILSHDVGADVKLTARQEKAMRTKMADSMGMKQHQIPSLYGGMFRGRFIVAK